MHYEKGSQEGVKDRGKQNEKQVISLHFLNPS
jgi:hypothetical protein